jgi:hypothetical protein
VEKQVGTIWTKRKGAEKLIPALFLGSSFLFNALFLSLAG